MARMEDLPTTRSEDELLQEYLHLINAKDQRVHELLKELEDCQCAAAKREADLRDQAVAAEEALAEAQTHMKDLQRKAKDDDRTIHIMAQANERLQNEVLQVRVQLAQRKLLAQEAEQRWTMEVCELQGRHKHGFITTRRLVEDHNRLSRKLAEVKARAASLSNTADELQKHLHQAELRNTEEVGRATALENKLEQMVPRVESEAAIRTVEESLAEHMRIHERTKERLELNLATTREKLELADASLVKAQREVEDRTTKLQKMSEEYAAHQQQATLSRQAAQHREEALQKEVEQMQKEHRVAVDRAAESERHAASLSEQLKLSASNLHTLTVQHERIKVEKDQLDQAHRELVRQSQDASSHARAEMERLQHEAKAKDGAMAKSADELATLRERSARDIGELKEKLSAMATAETSRNAELHRLELDVKRTQQQLDEAASRHQRQLAEMAAKVDEEMHLRQRAQQQLQSAEEGHRRLELTARGELEALQHKHAELLQDVRHGKQTEAAEAAQRLDQCREELALTRGGRTGVQQELEATGGSFRHALEENGRLRNRVALSDEQVAAQQREVGSLKAAAQAHEAHEAQLKAQLDQLRSSLCEREGSVAELQRALQQAKEDAQRGEAQRERTHLQTVSELQRRVEQCQSVADAQRGRAADVEASLRELQHAHRTLEHQRDVLAEKHQRASEYIAAGKADIAHLRTLLETKDVELVRVTAHAGEVEDLAKRTREELQRTFTARDAQVSAAKADIARLLRELAEERRQAAQAQGRCQQLAEEQRATQTLAEETQRRHRASEEELARLRAQTMSAEEQMRELDGILKVRDQQLRLAEEEVVRVRGQLERRGEEMAEVKAHAEAEASSLREKAQRDRARLKEAASSSPHHHRRGSTAERLERSGASAATSSSPCDRCRRMERRLTTSIADQLSDFVDEALWCKSNLHRIALTAHANAIYSMKAAGATAAASKRRVRVAAFTPPPHPRGRLGRAEAGRDDDDDDDDDVRQGGPSSSPVVGEDTETLALHLRRTKMDLAKLREEAAHHATQAAQLRSQLLEAENRSAASRAELQQERQALRQQQERTSRQLNDRLAEHRHNEDELRDLRAELAAAQRRMTEQAAQLQEYKVRQRLEAERVERSTEGRTAAAAEVAQLRAEAQECREQLRRAKTGHQADVQAARERQRSIEAQQDALRSSLSSCEADKRRLEKQVQSLTVERDALREELSDIRQCDGQHATQLHITKAELSALKERLANVESLKAISDNALLQVQTREQELLRRIEELRGDQQLLQLCFNRQQQQLLQSRRGSGVAEE